MQSPLAQPFAATSCVLQEAVSCKTCGHGWPTQKETREAIQCRVGTQVRSKDCVLSIFWGHYCLANNVCAYGKLTILFRIKDMAHPAFLAMSCGIIRVIVCRQKVAAPDATSKGSDAADVGSACR